ncbi:MAG: UbiD family decarboxylase [Saprospiraceae bacterium]|nr:UbiD family decarboxylase [Saprospiraceae bacterium]
MYHSLKAAVTDLDNHKMLLRIKDEVNPDLEMAEIHRQVYDKKGPAIFFEKIKGSPFTAVSNLYGTIERTDFLFRHSMENVKKVIELKADPTNLLKKPFRYLNAPFTALTALPMKSLFKPSIAEHQTTIDQLPLVKSWPMDGGGFVTLPQVFTLPPDSRNMMQSNLGMYRIQLSGNKYEINEEIGMHFQLHRGIGIHHQQYNQTDKEFKVSIFVGGPPSHAFAAIMPMPEGITELTFAGMLANRRFRYYFDDMGHVLSSDADFVITGTIEKNRKLPEGPFGDHLGYYSLTHDFPVVKVDRVYHKKDAIWHFTVVGRPPQEDSSFGYIIHKLVKEMTPVEFPGLVSIHAVDAAGVHPLLLAVAKDRYMPFRDIKPEEIITIGNRILGSGQTSLAKFLFIAADDDGTTPDTHDIEAFFRHFLERVDWRRDLHFQTKTTIDTLDYSGEGWNGGSKLMIACRGPKLRTLGIEIPSNVNIPSIVKNCKIALPGILAMEIGSFNHYQQGASEIDELADALKNVDLKEFPLIVVCDDASFMSENLNNFVWVTFTRANPSHDVYGVNSSTVHKHWGCSGSLIIDARKKPHHAPELVTDPIVSEKVETLLKKYKF